MKQIAAKWSMIKKKRIIQNPPEYLRADCWLETPHLREVHDPRALCSGRGEESRWAFEDLRVRARHPDLKQQMGSCRHQCRGAHHVSNGEWQAASQGPCLSVSEICKYTDTFSRPYTSGASRALFSLNHLQIKNQMSSKEERKVGLIPQFTRQCGFSQAPQSFLQGIYANGLINSEPVHST